MSFWDKDDDEQSDEEYERERKAEEERVKNLPIVRKAKDLFKTISAFMASIEDSEDSKDLKSSLFGDIAIINAKIRGAEAGDLYSIRMENAVLVKYHAVGIKNTMHAFEMFELGNQAYLDLIRNEIEEFRLIFVDWVASFKRTDEYPDEWGLFN